MLQQRGDLAGSTKAADLHASLTLYRALVQCDSNLRARRGEGGCVEVSRPSDDQYMQAAHQQRAKYALLCQCTAWHLHISIEQSMLCFASVQLGT